jgi:glycosyltransferase involved in cell wall biosynthesis
VTDLHGTRVAVANWRDPWHPQAGGAERYAWEMARGLASRRQACVAVSPSTVAAMRDRLRWTGDIYLIPNGSTVPEPRPPVISRHPSRLVWVGRLVAHKRAELILPVAGRGFAVDVIGRGPAGAALSEAIGSVPGLGEAVRLHGFLPDHDKRDIVAGSLLHLNTSQGEGWGLCVLEAAALGVPTVAYDVEGLRDAVRDGETGWLVKPGEQLADAEGPVLDGLVASGGKVLRPATTAERLLGEVTLVSGPP